jgi:hypothetical protein
MGRDISIVKILTDLDELRKQVDLLNYIGEAYVSYAMEWSSAQHCSVTTDFATLGHRPFRGWIPFHEKDVADKCPEGSVKILGVWCKPSHFFLYDDKNKAIRELKEKQMKEGE